MQYKVLSMLQPWATALVSGDKLVETRSFNTKHRGTLLIHGSLGLSKNQQLAFRDIHSEYPLSFVRPMGELGHSFVDMPRGAIIGKVDIIETFQFGSDRAIEYMRSLNEGSRMKECALGDWGEGRWGWLTANRVMFKTPIPAKGNLGIWNWEGELPELKQV